MSKLTNEQKFRTAEERVEAFMAHRSDKIPIVAVVANEFARWLAHEAEEEPEPCPFCDGAVQVMDAYKMNEPRIACGNCAYVSCAKPTKEEAIAAHNRVARAVRVAKESEEFNG